MPESERTVDEILEAKVLPEYLGIARRLRVLMRRYAPGAKEIVTYGIPGWRLRNIIAVLSPTKKGITLAFSRGAEFEDRYGQLEGVGKVSKNLRFKSVKEIDEAKLEYYIEQAAARDS
jgi:hypothetical protein